MARELVKLKNMTRGSNNPFEIRKAAFHLSPSLIDMLLYPHWISNLMNNMHPASWSITWGIRGETFLFFLVYLLRGQ